MSNTLNVLIVGEIGVGKSSVVNLIMLKDLIEVSSSATACTNTTDGSIFRPVLNVVENLKFKLEV